VNLSINYLAVVVAAAVSFVIGGIWHGPLFGRAEMAGRGATPEQIAAGPKPNPKQMLAVFLILIVVAWGLALLSGYLHLATWMQGLKLGVVCWVAFSTTTFLLEHIMTGSRKSAVFYIDVSSWLITYAVSGIVVTVWH
jgi:hypothetical protein